MPSIAFPTAGHGDLTIAWDESKHDAMVAQIQILMDKGVTFHKLEEQGKIRRKTVAVPISNPAEATGRKLLIKDPDIAKIVDAGLATIASFESCGDIKTVGSAKTAVEAASTDTVAVQPARGG
jgi:hypothetical protein